MRYVLSIILGILVVGCSSLKPMPIRAGDVCFRCGRVITDPDLGAQLIRKNGQASTFRSPACMARYLEDHPENVGALFVTDKPSGKLIRVDNATFVRVTIDKAADERDFYAFRSVTDAAKRADEEDSSVVDWSTVRAIAKSEKQGKPKATN
jgi:hypothetical protein